MTTELVSIPTLILSVFAIFILLLIVFALISRVRKNHRVFDQIAPSQIAYPFPSTASYPRVSIEFIDSVRAQTLIKSAYADWLAKLILPDQEPGQAFVRMGIEKNFLRYQVTSTSFGQALGMFFALVMAGSDLNAHQRFERLLAFCLSHPASDQPELTSWQSMPDVKPSRRQEADLHAENWIAFAILAAQRQWQVEGRFNLGAILIDRLTALRSACQNRPSPEDKPCRVATPAFWKLFAAQTSDPAWLSLISNLKSQSRDVMTRENYSFTETNSPEAVQLAFQTLNLGIDALVNGIETHKDLSGKLIQLSRFALEAYQASPKRAEILEDQSQFTPLAHLACCAPAVIAYGDSALVQQFWNALEIAETSKFDPLGTSLRLLALIILAGLAWPLSLSAKPFDSAQ